MRKLGAGSFRKRLPRLRKALGLFDGDRVMEEGVIIPLAFFGFVVLIVAIIHVAKVRDLETEAARLVHAEQLEHQRKMRELNLELERVRGKSQSPSPES